MGASESYTPMSNKLGIPGNALREMNEIVSYYQHDKYDGYRRLAKWSEKDKNNVYLGNKKLGFLPILMGVIKSEKGRALGFILIVTYNLSLANENKTYMGSKRLGLINVLALMLTQVEIVEHSLIILKTLHNLSYIQRNQSYLGSEELGLLDLLVAELNNENALIKHEAIECIWNLSKFWVSKLPTIGLVQVLTRILPGSSNETKLKVLEHFTALTENGSEEDTIDLIRVNSYNAVFKVIRDSSSIEVRLWGSGGTVTSSAITFIMYFSSHSATHSALFETNVFKILNIIIELNPPNCCEVTKAIIILGFLVGKDEDFKEYSLLLFQRPKAIDGIFNALKITIERKSGPDYSLGTFSLKLLMTVCLNLSLSDSRKESLCLGPLLFLITLALESYSRNEPPVRNTTGSVAGGGEDIETAEMAIDILLQLSCYYESDKVLQLQFLTKASGIVPLLKRLLFLELRHPKLSLNVCRLCYILLYRLTGYGIVAPKLGQVAKNRQPSLVEYTNNMNEGNDERRATTMRVSFVNDTNETDKPTVEMNVTSPTTALSPSYQNAMDAASAVTSSIKANKIGLIIPPNLTNIKNRSLLSSPTVRSSLSASENSTGREGERPSPMKRGSLNASKYFSRNRSSETNILGSSQDISTNSQDPVLIQPNKKHIFFSYIDDLVATRSNDVGTRYVASSSNTKTKERKYDAECVKALRDTFQAQGYDVWTHELGSSKVQGISKSLDDIVIENGAEVPFDPSILRLHSALQHSAHAVIFVSQAYKDSPYGRYEAKCIMDAMNATDDTIQSADSFDIFQSNKSNTTGGNLQNNSIDEENGEQNTDPLDNSSRVLSTKADLMQFFAAANRSSGSTSRNVTPKHGHPPRNRTEPLKIYFVMVQSGYNTVTYPNCCDGWLRKWIGDEQWYPLWDIANHLVPTSFQLLALIEDDFNVPTVHPTQHSSSQYPNPLQMNRLGQRPHTAASDFGVRETGLTQSVTAEPSSTTSLPPLSHDHTGSSKLPIKLRPSSSSMSHPLPSRGVGYTSSFAPPINKAELTSTLHLLPESPFTLPHMNHNDNQPNHNSASSQPHFSNPNPHNVQHHPHPESNHHNQHQEHHQEHQHHHHYKLDAAYDILVNPSLVLNQDTMMKKLYEFGVIESKNLLGLEMPDIIELSTLLKKGQRKVFIKYFE